MESYRKERNTAQARWLGRKNAKRAMSLNKIYHHIRSPYKAKSVEQHVKQERHIERLQGIGSIGSYLAREKLNIHTSPTLLRNPPQDILGMHIQHLLHPGLLTLYHSPVPAFLLLLPIPK